MSFGGRFLPLFVFAVMGMVLTQNVSGNQNVVKFGFKITFLYPWLQAPFWQGIVTNPAPDAHSRPQTLFLCLQKFFYPEKSKMIWFF